MLWIQVGCTSWSWLEIGMLDILGPCFRKSNSTYHSTKRYCVIIYGMRVHLKMCRVCTISSRRIQLNYCSWKKWKISPGYRLHKLFQRYVEAVATTPKLYQESAQVSCFYIGTLEVPSIEPLTKMLEMFAGGKSSYSLEKLRRKRPRVGWRCWNAEELFDAICKCCMMVWDECARVVVLYFI